MLLDIGIDTQTLENILSILNTAIGIIDAILIFFFSYFYVAYFFTSITRTKKIKRYDPLNKFAILIPARNESKVIRNMLDSMKKQTYPKELFDVFVIVEDALDPTCEIVKEYGYNLVIRKDLEGKRTKGYALDEAYQYIKEHNLEYDAFMVFDADNIASSDYIASMNDIKCEGYQIGCGYRNFTNATQNWIAATSATLFSFMNSFTSKGRTILFNKATLTGTGYFVEKKIVDDAGGWIWNGMTEDVELTYYAYKNNIKMKYYSKAQYFDEQTTSYKTLHNQHVRWVWGFFFNKKKFKNLKRDYNPGHKFKRIMGLLEYHISIYPFVTFIILEVVSSIVGFSFAIASIPSGSAQYSLNLCIGAMYHLLLIYLVFCFLATLTICIDNHHLKFNFATCLLIILTYPLFFADFLFAFLDGLFNKKKRTNWKPIEHKGDITDDAAKNSVEEEK